MFFCEEEAQGIFCLTLLVNRNKRGRQRKRLKKREDVVCDNFEIVKKVVRCKVSEG